MAPWWWRSNRPVGAWHCGVDRQRAPPSMTRPVAAAALGSPSGRVLLVRPQASCLRCRHRLPRSIVGSSVVERAGSVRRRCRRQGRRVMWQTSGGRRWVTGRLAARWQRAARAGADRARRAHRRARRRCCAGSPRWNGRPGVAAAGGTRAAGLEQAAGCGDTGDIGR
jgi:hypothetical protein